MEDLNKNQIILLALLVSFVAAVATSIMTYSLLNEAPPTVTQTINRVVERTVETVVPQQSKPDVVTKEVTVVVKEEDLVIDAISKNKSSLVRLMQPGVSGGENTFVSIGLILNDEGFIITKKISADLTNVALKASLPDGKIVDLEKISDSENFSSFKIKDLTGITLTRVVLGDSDSIQLGQSLISIRGVEKNEVSTGRVTGTENFELEEGRSSILSFDSDVLGSLPGSPAINLKGEILGISTGEEGIFISTNLIKAELESLTQI